jgi:hypothetical protein
MTQGAIAYERVGGGHHIRRIAKAVAVIERGGVLISPGVPVPYNVPPCMSAHKLQSEARGRYGSPAEPVFPIPLAQLVIVHRLETASWPH